LRQEAGFGLVELLMAMTILNVGILAVVAGFNSGIVALRRSGAISTGTVLADKQMELYRRPDLRVDRAGSFLDPGDDPIHVRSGLGFDPR
jgi:type II secretory pathway pseudopilin PulG